MRIAPTNGRTRFAILRAAAISLWFSALALSGCTAVEGSGPTTSMRVIDAAYNSQALDAYVSSALIAANFAGPSISNYAYLPPGNSTIQIKPTGKTTVLTQIPAALQVSQQHTIFITGEGANLQTVLLNDQTTAAPAGSFAVRFLQQAVATGPVDIYFVPDGTALADAKPVLSALAPGAITAYINIPAGTYDLVVVPAGTIKNAYTSAATAFDSGQVRTVLILDQQLLNSPPINVLIASDVN